MVRLAALPTEAIKLAAACKIARPQFVRVFDATADPTIDEPGKPFSYFWHPTDVIGTLYAPVATEVTPEGYLYTGGNLLDFVKNIVSER